jgi:lysophospholipase L1-like esterase
VRLPGVAAVAATVPDFARAWEEENAVGPAGSEPLWVVLGDSLSQGVGAPSYRRGWVGQADTALRLHGRAYRVVNLSRSGATTTDVAGRQLAALADLPGAPALVTLLAGANDLFRLRGRGAVLPQMTAILARLPACSVVALLPQPLPIARRVNAAILVAARSAGFETVDVRPAARRFRGHRAADRFHPNDRGHARIAEVFVPAILRVPYPGPASARDAEGSPPSRG